MPIRIIIKLPVNENSRSQRGDIIYKGIHGERGLQVAGSICSLDPYGIGNTIIQLFIGKGVRPVFCAGSGLPGFCFTPPVRVVIKTVETPLDQYMNGRNTGSAIPCGTLNVIGTGPAGIIIEIIKYAENSIGLCSIISETIFTINCLYIINIICCF